MSECNNEKLSRDSLDSILNSIQERKATFLLGAGISKSSPSNLPLGRELTSHILKCLCRGTLLKKFYKDILMKENLLSTRLFAYPFEGFIEFFQRNYSILESLATIFKSEKSRPNIFHILIAKLANEGYVQDVMTTNFDLLLEKAFKQENMKENVNFRVYFNETRFRDYSLHKAKMPTLIKIHGSAHRVSSMRATLDVISGQRLIRKRTQAIRSFFEVPGRTIIVLGYSAKDEFDINPAIRSVVPVSRIFYVNHRPAEKKVENLSYPFESFAGQMISCDANEVVESIWHRIIGNAKLPQQREQVSDLWKEQVEGWSKGLTQGLRYYFLGRLLVNVGELKTSVSFLKKATRYFEKEANKQRTASALYELASINERLERHSIARYYCRLSQTLFKQVHDDQGLAATLHLMGMIEQSIGNYGVAEQIYKRSMRKSSRIGKRIGLAASLHQLGVIYKTLGKPEKARKMFLKSLAIKRTRGDLANLATTMDHLARIEDERGHFNKAKQILAKAREIYTKLLDDYGVAISQLSLGMIELKCGNPTEADRLFRESLKIFRELGNHAGIAAALHQIAFVKQSEGLFPQAEKLYVRALRIKKDTGDIIGAVATLNQLAQLKKDSGAFTDAIIHYEEALAIAEKHGLRPEVGAILFNIGVTHHNLQHHNEAMILYKRSIRVKKSIGDALGVAYVYHQIARVHQDQGRYLKAKTIYQDILKIFRKFGDKTATSSTLHNLATVYQRLGKKSLARRLSLCSLKLAEQFHDLQATVKGNLQMGQFYAEGGDRTSAFKYYSNALRFAKKSGNPILVKTCLNRLNMMKRQ